MSKKEFILSKFLTVVFFAVVSTIFVFIMSLLLGYNFSSYNEIGIVFSDLEYLVAYFVKLVGFFSFCLFLGVLIKRSAFAIGFLFIWFIGETIARLTLTFDIFPKSKIASQITQFFPLESMSNLIVEPFSRLSVIKNIQETIGENNSKDFGVHPIAILIVLVWTAIFIYSSYLLIKKRDL
jgi:ABC-type transport system involved in multi-copper enzyme maturation permease subunit